MATIQPVYQFVPLIQEVLPDGRLCTYNPIERENITLKQALQQSLDKIEILEGRLLAKQTNLDKALKSVKGTEDINHLLVQKIKQLQRRNGTLEEELQSVGAEKIQVTSLLEQVKTQNERDHAELRALQEERNSLIERVRILEGRDHKSQERRVWRAKDLPPDNK
jgi:hypothetical protein